jgi:hypothetical protein
MGPRHQHPSTNTCQLQRPGVWILHGLLSRRILWSTVDYNFPPSTRDLLQTSPPAPTIWCDSLSVVKTVNKLISRNRPEFPNETLRPSWDILQAICGNFKLHPELKLHPEFTLLHVKGHQDSLSDPNDLPFPAQLNIQADLLAITFQQVSSHRTAREPVIPGTGYHLLIENQFIPANHRRHLRSR